MTSSGNSPRKATPAQQDYAWLERTRQVFQQLAHSPDSAALQGIISEGQARLEKVTPEDVLLAGFLRLAVAEAQIKLGLELDDAQECREAFASGRENCEQVALATQESSCGVACILLPRVITLLAALYKASDELRTPALADSMQSIASQLDDALLEQAYLRHKALDKLQSARLLATTLESLSPEDRRQLLVQVANQMLEAGEDYLESGDEEMVAQVQTDLVAIENALNDPALPIPSLALFETPLDEKELKTEEAEEEQIQVKPFVAAQLPPPQTSRLVQPSKRQRSSPLRWVISIGGLVVSCLTILCSGASLYTGWANRAAANGEETTLHLTQSAFAVQMTAGSPANTIPLETDQWIEPTPPFEMPTPPASSAISCPGAPASRLQIGDQASVGNVGGYSLTIYEAPGYQSTELYYLEEGDFLSIIGGPVCIQNQYWWEVNLDQGHTGWTPENSETGAYLLIP